MKHLHNSILFLVLTFVAGCGGSLVTTWHGARGHGEANPITSSYESSDEFRECLTDREHQRETRIAEICRFAGGSCSSTHPVSYREATLLLCAQSDRSEVAGESRMISRADCERLLASDGIPADATGSVTTTSTGTSDPRLAWLVASGPVLYQDDHAFCMNATSSYGVPGSGYVGYGYGSGGGYYGGTPVIGTVGGGSGIYGTIVTAPLPVTGR